MILTEAGARLGGWFDARHHRLPLLLWALSVGALLLARPFRIMPDSLWLDIPCLVTALGGIALRALIAGYASAGESLRTRGPYSLCRHPAALGSYLIWIAVFSYTGISGWLLCGGLLYGWILEKMLLVEETRLEERYGSAYQRYAASTNTLLPRWKSWTHPGEPFSLLRALRRACADLLSLTVVLLPLSLLKNRMISFRWTVDPFWLWTGVAALLLALILFFAGSASRRGR